FLDLAHGLAARGEDPHEQQCPHACHCLRHAHHLLVNVWEVTRTTCAGSCPSSWRLRSVLLRNRPCSRRPRLGGWHPRLERQPHLPRRRPSCWRNPSSSCPSAPVRRCSHPTCVASSLAPPLVPGGEARGGLGKATPLLAQKDCARNQASDGCGKASHRLP